LAEAHASLGTVTFWFERDWDRAEASFKRALELDPDSALAHTNYAHLLSNIGRAKDARAAAERARQLDPYLAYSFFIQGLAYQQAGNDQGENFDQALRQFEEGSRLDPRFWLGHMFTAIAYVDLKRYEDAIAYANEASKLNRAQSISAAYKSVANARLGRRKEAKALLDGS
jgi:tetratricopeptide (TPR) repeat protein